MRRVAHHQAARRVQERREVDCGPAPRGRQPQGLLRPGAALQDDLGQRQGLRGHHCRQGRAGGRWDAPFGASRWPALVPAVSRRWSGGVPRGAHTTGSNLAPKAACTAQRADVCRPPAAALAAPPPAAAKLPQCGSLALISGANTSLFTIQTAPYKAAGGSKTSYCINAELPNDPTNLCLANNGGCLPGAACAMRGDERWCTCPSGLTGDGETFCIDPGARWRVALGRVGAQGAASVRLVCWHRFLRLPALDLLLPSPPHHHQRRCRPRHHTTAAQGSRRQLLPTTFKR
jgi:hypothetical protein